MERRDVSAVKPVGLRPSGLVAAAAIVMDTRRPRRGILTHLEGLSVHRSLSLGSQLSRPLYDHSRHTAMSVKSDVYGHCLIIMLHS